jgi:hypothetical protein
MLSEVSQKTFRQKRKNILFAVSNPCFELWLYLHVAECPLDKDITSNMMEKMLRNKLGSYNKTNLDIEKFQGLVKVACERARKLDTKPTDRWPQTIGTHVYRLIDEISNFCEIDCNNENILTKQ